MISNSTNILGELKKTWRARFQEAEIKIGDLERKLQWCNRKIGEMLVAVTALAKHANLSPEEAQRVVLEYMDKEDARLAMEQQEKAKKDLMDKMAKGEKIEFVNRMDGPDDGEPRIMD